MPKFHMGYIGAASIEGTKYFVTGSSLNPVQTVNAPDVVAGHKMRRGWNYGKVEIGGNVTGPYHTGAGSLFAQATERGSGADQDHMSYNDLTVEIAYYWGAGRKFTGCSINNMQIACTAGDVATFTVDFFGTKVEDSTFSGAVGCSKLITWDRCKLSTTKLKTANTQAFTATFNNNLQRLYAITAGADSDLFPIDVPAGPLEVTGTISLYAEGPLSAFGLGGSGAFGADNWGQYESDQAKQRVTMQIGNPAVASAVFDAVFHRPESVSQTGPTIYTLNFTGVCDLT